MNNSTKISSAISSYETKAIAPEHSWVTQAYAAMPHFDSKSATHAAFAAVPRNPVAPVPLHEQMQQQAAPQTALLGTTLAAGASAPLLSAESAAAAGRMLTTAVKWGSQLFKVSPWGWAAGAAWWAYDSGALSKVASAVNASAHALLGAPPGLLGGKEEVLALPDQGPMVLGGAPLPPALQHGAPTGYEAHSSGPTAHVYPEDSDAHRSQDSGGRTALTPKPADHILLVQSALKNEPRAERTGTERPGIADHPAAPIPRMNFADDVVVKSLNGSASAKHFEYKFRAPPSALKSGYVVAEIDGVVVDGVMKFKVMALGDPAVRPSATDLVTNVIHALKKEGVEVHGFLNYWPANGHYTENNRRFYEVLEKEAQSPGQTLPDDLTFAASQTFTGKLAKQYGMSPQSVFVFSSGDVQVFYENSLHKKLFGSIRNQ